MMTLQERFLDALDQSDERLAFHLIEGGASLSMFPEHSFAPVLALRMKDVQALRDCLMRGHHDMIERGQMLLIECTQCFMPDQEADYQAMFELLLEHGADPNAGNWPAFDIARLLDDGSLECLQNAIQAHEKKMMHQAITPFLERKHAFAHKRM